MNRPLQGQQQPSSLNAQQRLAARDPATDPTELRRLFAQRGEIGYAFTEDLARNPAMPLDLLKQLVIEAPGAFCRNPIAPLVSLEEPDFVEKVSALGIARMLRYARAPSPLVHQIAESHPNAYLREVARMHIQVNHLYPSRFSEAGWADRVRQFLQEWISSMAEREHKQELIELVELGAIPATMASVGARWPVPELEDYDILRKRLSFNQAQALEQGFTCHPVKDRTLLSQKQTYILVGASLNPEITLEQKNRWAGHIRAVAEALTRNPGTSPVILARLVRHTDIAIRRAALHNPSCPSDALESCKQFVFAGYLRALPETYLWADSGRRHPAAFRRFVALVSASEPVRRRFFRRFARSPLWEDRLAVALAIDLCPNGQPTKPKHRVLLEQLANDGICLVRAAAQARLRGEIFTIAES